MRYGGDGYDPDPEEEHPHDWAYEIRPPHKYQLIIHDHAEEDPCWRKEVSRTVRTRRSDGVKYTEVVARYLYPIPLNKEEHHPPHAECRYDYVHRDYVHRGIKKDTLVFRQHLVRYKEWGPR